MYFNAFKMRTVLTKDVSKTIQNTMINLKFISEGKVTTPKHFVLKLSNHFEVTCMSGIH